MGDEDATQLLLVLDTHQRVPFVCFLLSGIRNNFPAPRPQEIA